MKAVSETLTERGEQYGDFKQMALLATLLKNALRSDKMNATQREAISLICTKLARIVVGNPHNRDSWHDIAGYSLLVLEQMDREDEL